ncbi:uL15 family ribosomal protein [Patescibacteria group bacterium]|nr:uL15 family ribosomal protein [Patescibacteria group bacterium]
MSISLSNLKSTIKRKKKKRVGRGDSSKGGNYAGRGRGGQRSRSGGKKGLKIRGLKRNIRNLPKLKGFKSSRQRLAILKLVDLEKLFKNKDIIGPKELKKLNLIKTNKTKYKVLMSSTSISLKKELNIKAHAFSKQASQAIVKAKGKAIIINSIK